MVRWGLKYNHCLQLWCLPRQGAFDLHPTSKFNRMAKRLSPGATNLKELSAHVTAERGKSLEEEEQGL